MARWGVSTWLAFVRCLQVLDTLASAALNGFLLVYIHTNRLGLSQTMFALEIMTCVILIYTAIVLLIHHRGKRRLRPRNGLVVASVVGDAVFTGLTIGIITMLARAGVPSNCGGLTRSDFSKDDAPNNPPDGYSTIRFSYGGLDEKGVLDKFCGFERAYYFLSVAMIFSYMVTVTLAILRLYEGSYTRNTEVDQELATASELYHIKAKVSTAHSNLSSTQVGTPASPMQEGIISPRPGSIQSPVHEQERRPTLAVRTATTPTISTSSTAPTLPTPTIIITDPSRERLLEEEMADQTAEAAMITDGYRQTQPGMPVLPPYTPGESSRFMAGHGSEDNEMRLSGYVKGETRAQNMKNGGL